MAKVSRSRLSCSTSLATMARRRRQNPPPKSRIERIVARLAHEVDEDVFQRRLRLLPVQGRIAAIRLDRLEKRRAIGAADMQRGAERGGGGYARRIAQMDGQTIGAGTRGHEGHQAGLPDNLLRRAAC